MVFASPSGEFYRDMTNPFSLSGHNHLDSFILIRNFRLFIGTMQKRMPTPTQTATPYTTEPLAHIFVAVGLSLRAVLIKFYHDNINSALLPGLALARQTFCHRAVTRKICYLINNAAFYRDSPNARRKIHVLTAKASLRYLD
jgi:hypothetical protein